MENTMNNYWTISSNFDLLKKFASELLINGDSPESKYIEVMKKLDEGNISDEYLEELDDICYDLQVELKNKYDTDYVGDIENAFIYEILCDPKKMIAFKDYAEKNNRPLSINYEEIEKVSNLFSKLETVTFESLALDTSNPKFRKPNHYREANDYNYEEIVSEMVREYDACLQIYKHNNDDGLLYMRRLDIDMLHSEFCLIYSFLNGGKSCEETNGLFDDEKISPELGLQCLLYLTSTPEPYGLDRSYLANAIYYNHCLFEIDSETKNIKMRNPDTLKEELQKFAEENATHYDERYFVHELFDDYGHYKVKSKEDVIEPTGRSL